MSVILEFRRAEYFICMLQVRYYVHYSNASIMMICLTANTGGRIPFTNSESEPPMAPPAVSDQPKTDPTTMHYTMLTPSRQLSSIHTVSTSGGQLLPL